MNFQTPSNRGLCWEKKGDYEKAITDFDQALASQAQYFEAAFDRGRVHENSGKKKDAILDYRLALLLAKNDSQENQAQDALRKLNFNP